MRDQFSTIRKEGKNLIDAPPGPVPGASRQAPELAGARGAGVARPRGGNRWVGGEGNFREKGLEVEPGSKPIRGPCREVCPRAQVEAPEGPEERVVVEAGEAE